jgi:hypothetical protein
MSGGQLQRIRRGGDAGALLNNAEYAALEHEMAVCQWRRVHNSPLLVVWKNCEGMFCHAAIDGESRVVAWVSR